MTMTKRMMRYVALVALLVVAGCSGVGIDPGLTFGPGGATIDPVLTE